MGVPSGNEWFVGPNREGPFFFLKKGALCSRLHPRNGKIYMGAGVGAIWEGGFEYESTMPKLYAHGYLVSGHPLSSQQVEAGAKTATAGNFCWHCYPLVAGSISIRSLRRCLNNPKHRIESRFESSESRGKAVRKPVSTSLVLYRDSLPTPCPKPMQWWRNHAPPLWEKTTLETPLWSGFHSMCGILAVLRWKKLTFCDG